VLSSPFLAAGLVLSLGASYIVPIVFGPQYTGSIPLLRIMAFIPFVASIQFCFSTYYLLGLGYMDDWGRITRRSSLTSFAMLGLLLLIFRPELAVAISLLTTDLIALGAAYAFYLRTAPRHLDTSAAAAAEKASHIETAPK
jgi:PST family polysaccharide transporter